MQITWKPGKEFPVMIKGGAMGLVNGAPVYAGGMTYPWRETEQACFSGTTVTSATSMDDCSPCSDCLRHEPTPTRTA